MSLVDEVLEVATDTSRLREDILDELLHAQEEINSWVIALEEDGDDFVEVDENEFSPKDVAEPYRPWSED